jgi:glycosyltransferase involved in cell wall biosynthesis
VRDIYGDQRQGLVESGNVAALAEAVTWTLAHPREASERAKVLRLRACERFDWSQVASRYARLLRGKS